jgi:hypothetical protein
MFSVRCGEVMEGLAETQGDQPFAMQILKTQPEMDRKAVRRLKNQYWNAFKHFFDMKGIPREDEQLLAKFSDVNNDVALFIRWLDYMKVQKRLPISVQVFQVWWYALNDEKLSPHADLDVVRSAFPEIRQQPRAEQKRRLRRMIEKNRKSDQLLSDPATEAE